MKIKLDENIPWSIYKLLKKQNYDVENVYMENIAGIDDKELWRKVIKEKRIFLTLDLDFSDIRNYHLKDHAGLIIIRVKRKIPSTIRILVIKLINKIDLNNIKNKLIVIDHKKIRIKSTSSL